MLRNDYIMRMIEQFTQVLQKILFKKAQGQFEEARIDIDQAFTELLGLDHAVVRVLSPGGLLALLKLNGRLDVERCRIAAGLLREDGEVLELKRGEGAGFESYQKAFCLSAELLKQPDDRYEEEADRNIRFIIPKLEPYALPVGVCKYLVEYYELRGDYARAREMVSRVTESNDPEALEYGKQFFQRLLSRPDEDLRRGRLPREAAEAGLKALERRRRNAAGESG